MKKEKDSRKKQILAAITELELNITVFVSAGHKINGLKHRELCMKALVTEVVASGATRLCIERDATLERFDKQLIIEELRSLGGADLTYWHDSAAAESLLSIPDAIAWAWPKGGHWRRECGEVNIQEVSASEA